MKIFSLLLFCLFACAVNSRAWLRASYEDETLVQRAELIAIGHLKDGSIEYVPHTNNPTKGNWWEYHATLVVTEVLKGKAEGSEIPIIIHYGLDPVVGGHLLHDGLLMGGWRDEKKDYPTNLVQIHDTSMHWLGNLLVEDASKDNLWLLRRGTGIYGWEPGTNNLGIVDPQDLQPLKLEDYFKTYLAPNPEQAVAAYAKGHPEFADRAEHYAKHLEVQRILKIEDPAKRMNALLPHYLSGEWWLSPKRGIYETDEIRGGIISCGAVGGEKLIPAFENPAHRDLRDDIIFMWREMHYTNAAPTLIKLLADDDKFWNGQTLTTNWWNDNSNSELTKKRQRIYGEIYYSVALLKDFRDSQAKEAIELTQKRWQTISFDNPQILKECAAALKAFADPVKGS